MKTPIALIAGLVCVIAVVLVVSRTVSPLLEVSADDEGWFVSTEPAARNSVYPGDGVTLVVVEPKTRGVAGRLDPKSASPFVWERTADGKLAARSLRIGKSKESRAATVRAAAVASLPHASELSTTEAFAESCGREAPTRAAVRFDSDGPRSAVVCRDFEAKDGEPPLEAFAPAECLFVRFRSVEAAYRFVSTFDGLVAALLAANAEDARDYGSLRLALHDLMLPTIWRTNPEAQRGVGEVGLVVAPPFVRGRLSVAVLLRITDSELHRMQTVAGIAQQLAPDHLWSPADDPFPAERDLVNFRENPEDAPRIEVVATSQALGEKIVRRRAERIDTGGYDIVRQPTLTADGVPPPNEAAFFYSWLAGNSFARRSFPGILRTTACEEREGLGVRWLAKKWLGVDNRPVTADDRSHGPSILASIESVRVVTDENGAQIDATFVDAKSASLAASALSSLASAAPAADRACARNLVDLVPLALVEKPDDIAERSFVVLGWKPVCPCGGTYSVHPVTREVSCSAHGTVAAPRTAKFVPPPVSDVRADGTSLSFRLAIDWNRRE